MNLYIEKDGELHLVIDDLECFDLSKNLAASCLIAEIRGEIERIQTNNDE
jgi:hypothetical protein